MKYESELNNEILKKRGHELSSLHYQSECVKTWIDETKGAYPKLCDYQSEWLNYILENPIGDFPYEIITTNSTATVNNVVPLAYKNAIFKGCTNYRDIDTGEFLETFEEGRNLELVSVKMPVLTTYNSNLFSVDKINTDNVSWDGESVTITPTDAWYGSVFSSNITVPKGDYYFKKPKDTGNIFVHIHDENEAAFIKKYLPFSFTNPKDQKLKYKIFVTQATSSTTPVTLNEIQINKNDQRDVSYEPHKSNILTVNEDVTLRSNGDICDELNLLTGQLTQRIGDDGVVLSQEVINTVDLMITDQNGESLSKIKPIEGTMNIEVTGVPIPPIAILEIPVEAITQNLQSFIEEE